MAVGYLEVKNENKKVQRAALFLFQKSTLTRKIDVAIIISNNLANNVVPKISQT